MMDFSMYFSILVNVYVMLIMWITPFIYLHNKNNEDQMLLKESVLPKHNQNQWHLYFTCKNIHFTSLSRKTV